MKKTCYVLVSITVLVLLGCSPAYDTWTVINNSSYKITVYPYNQDWTIFAINPGQTLKIQVSKKYGGQIAFMFVSSSPNWPTGQAKYTTDSSTGTITFTDP
jgi:hypothetical protein